jgi:hypothetical protein
MKTKKFKKLSGAFPLRGKAKAIREMAAKHDKNFYDPKGKTSEVIDFTAQYLAGQK